MDRHRRGELSASLADRLHRPLPAPPTGPGTGIEETLSALTHLIRGGKVRAIGASRTPASGIVEAQWAAERRGLLVGLDVTLTDDVLDRIDEIVPPGADVGPLDQAYQPPAVENPGLRRRPLDERAAARR
jgi:Aldo/keto reductase family